MLPYVDWRDHRWCILAEGKGESLDLFQHTPLVAEILVDQEQDSGYKGIIDSD